jgi:ATP-dependent Clp protease ATP-binding subunit ClpB
MSSNVGSHFIAEVAVAQSVSANETGVLDEGTRRQVLETLRQSFRPEFLNRVDEIIVFTALTRAEMRQIIDIQLRGLMKRLEDRKIRVELSDAVKDLLIAEGYDPTYGARPLKRAIQREVLDPLAMRVLQGDFREGDTVTVDAAGGEVQFRKAEKSVPA